jgi:hypothetical protein
MFVKGVMISKGCRYCVDIEGARFVEFKLDEAGIALLPCTNPPTTVYIANLHSCKIKGT